MSHGASPTTPASAVPPAAFWTLPNAVSLSRVVLAAAFPLVAGPASRVALVVAASLSDFLDGWLARRSNVVSRLGTLIDPLADRAFVFAAVATLLSDGALTRLQVAVLLFRDIMTAIGFIVARIITWLRPVMFRSRPLGKGVTVLQLTVLFAAILRPSTVPAMVAAVGVTSVAATIDYTYALWRERDRSLKP